MIERRTIDGRSAVVAHLDDDWKPVDDADKATIIKLMFDDGDQMFLAGPAAGDPDDEEDNDMTDKRYPITDAMRLRALDSYLDRSERLSAGMRRHRVVTPDDELADGDDPREAAYSAMKKRLGSPRAGKPKKAPPAWGQEWQR